MSGAAGEEAPVETPTPEATKVPEETEAPVETAAPEVTEAPTAVPETSMTLKAPANEEEAKNVVGAAETDNWVREALLLSGVNAGKETNANNRLADLTYYEAASKELKITPNSQVKYAVFSYDADKQYIGWSGWSKSEKYTLKDGAVYFRVEAQGDG